MFMLAPVYLRHAFRATAAMACVIILTGEDIESETHGPITTMRSDFVPGGPGQPSWPWPSQRAITYHIIRRQNDADDHLSPGAVS